MNRPRTFENIHKIQSTAVAHDNSKLSVSKVLLRIKQKFELQHENIVISSDKATYRRKFSLFK